MKPLPNCKWQMNQKFLRTLRWQSIFLISVSLTKYKEEYIRGCENSTLANVMIVH